MMIPLLLLATIGIVHSILFSRSYPTLNIALHAQVSPSSGKVVGSVMTTDGLRSAFQLRPEIQHCETFYPFAYQSFYDKIWDLVIIEGWFPGIDDFIQLTRSHSPDAIIFFYCLDPAYPGLKFVKLFDVDGYLTNSKVVEAQLSRIQPTLLVLLAANPIVMRQNVSIDKVHLYPHA